MKEEKGVRRPEPKFRGRNGVREADYRVTFQPILPIFRGFITAF
jgi:hypothetical protein